MTPPPGHVDMWGTPASTSYDALFSGLWPRGIVERRNAVISFIKPIPTPLPHITRHIEQAFTGSPLGEGSHRHRTPGSGFSSICSRDVETVAPGVKAALCPPCCAFPFCFGGQSFALPCTIGIGVIPRNTHNGLVGIIVFCLAPIPGCRMPCARHKFAVLNIGYFVCINPVRIEINLVYWRVFILGISHKKMACGNLHLHFIFTIGRHCRAGSVLFKGGTPINCFDTQLGNFYPAGR